MVVLKLGTPFDYKGIFSPSERNEGESIVVGDHVANERETAKGGRKETSCSTVELGPSILRFATLSNIAACVKCVSELP